MITVIIPAHNEAALIGICLSALMASDPVRVPVEVIVVANGCTDATVAAAEAFAEPAAAKGWPLRVLDLPGLGKPGALNAGDAAASFPMRIYLDADVTVSPAVMAGLWDALDRPDAAYASGRVRITGQGAAARRYARLWSRVPFMAHGVPGCGLFAVNGPGRARWQEFPPIISDDTFVRLQFTPEERHLVDAPYDWPIAEGFGALVRVRGRQDTGVEEIARLYPGCQANDDKLPLDLRGKMALALHDPLGFLTYTGVALAVKLRPAPKDWSRGR